jgi:hypothetical protein
MGDKETLSSFIDWARTAYPQYTNQALIFWNHGGGVAVGSTQTTRSLAGAGAGIGPQQSICLDDEDYQNGYGLEGQLYLGEIQEVLGRYYSPTEGKLRVIGFDACYMGMYEVAHQFRDQAEYFSASPGLEFLGWNYEGLFGDAETFRDGASFVRNNVRLYAAISSSWDHTMTAFELAKTGDLKNAVDALGTALWRALEAEKASPGSGMTKETLETRRDGASIAYWRNSHVSPANQENESLYFPFFDLGSLCDSLKNSGISAINTAAEGVKNALASGIVYTWKNPESSDGGYEGSLQPYGLAIFFSRGDKRFRQGSFKSHYTSHWYYTSLDTNQWQSGFYYGHLDAADSNDNDQVETWRELMEYLYDPENKFTPGGW